MQKVKRLSDNLSSIERDFQGQSESFFGVHEGQGIEEVWENAEMRMEDRKRLVLGVRKAPDRISVLSSRGWAKLSSVTTVCWIPLSWAALPFVFVLLFVGTLSRLRYFSSEMEVFPPFWDRKADLHCSLSERQRRWTPCSHVSPDSAGLRGRDTPAYPPLSISLEQCVQRTSESEMMWHSSKDNLIPPAKLFPGFACSSSSSNKTIQTLANLGRRKLYVAPPTRDPTSALCPQGHRLAKTCGSLELSGGIESPVQVSNSMNLCVIFKLNWPSCDLKTAHINYLKIGIFYSLWFHYIKHG